jgi:hypothetical protein
MTVAPRVVAAAAIAIAAARADAAVVETAPSGFAIRHEAASAAPAAKV